MTKSQQLGRDILAALNRLKELGVDDPMLRSALRAFPNSPGDQMLFILGTMVSQGKVEETK